MGKREGEGKGTEGGRARGGGDKELEAEESRTFLVRKLWTRL